jgi:hypothetical protein
MTISLPQEIESRLKGEASRRGLAVEDYAKKLIVEHLPPATGENSLADLFAAWKTEDGTDDPAEVDRRNQEVEVFKQAMNRNRREMEGPDVWLNV